MTSGQRIFLNVIATYGRSVYALILGIFSSRWAFHALGEVDYGLWGLVGGMVSFVTFLNGILAGAVVRFYAISVGKTANISNAKQGLEDCRRWFNCALLVHSVIPVVLLIIGYPCGVWAVKNFLAIPADKIFDCVWVWRYTCAACFIGMVSVPFQAMYTAKQEIAELTIYGAVTATVNAAFLYYMVNHPGDWLTRYAAWMCCSTVLPQAVIILRAIYSYAECRLIRDYLFSPRHLKELCRFAIAKFWSRFSDVFSQQGQAIVVNKYMGVQYNSSMSIGNMLAAQASTLSGAISGAFAPAIINKVGEGDGKGVYQLSVSTCRLGAAMVILFAVPLSLEVEEVFRLWLGTPPPFAEEICLVILIRSLLEHMTDGYATAIYGSGTGVLLYSWVIGWAGISTVAISWGLFALGMGMWSIVIGLIFAKIMAVIIRVCLARKLVQFPIKNWIVDVLLPILAVLGVTVAIGGIPRLTMQASLGRVLLTALISTVVFMLMMWHFLLVKSEREKVKIFLRRFKNSH